MKNILVTGCAGGMGFSTCNLLAKNGYSVYGLDYKEPSEEFDWQFFMCDLTDINSVEHVYEEISAQLDSSFVAIIHLAGKYDLNSLIEISEEDFYSIFNINVFAIYRVNKVFYPLLSKEGRIVITASELAPLDPLPFNGIYSITKTTIEKYCHSLRMELQLHGQKVIEIRPGAVETGLLNISQNRINSFVENTNLYKVSGKNFLKITNNVESKSISPEKIAELIVKILKIKNPKFIYNINRNPLLLILNALPDRFQTWVIKFILKKGN